MWSGAVFIAAFIGIHFIFSNVNTLLETTWPPCFATEEGHLASMAFLIKCFKWMMFIFFGAIATRFGNLISGAWAKASDEYEATRTSDDEIPQANDDDGF